MNQKWEWIVTRATRVTTRAAVAAIVAAMEKQEIRTVADAEAAARRAWAAVRTGRMYRDSQKALAKARAAAARKCVCGEGACYGRCRHCYRSDGFMAECPKWNQ